MFLMAISDVLKSRSESIFTATFCCGGAGRAPPSSALQQGKGQTRCRKGWSGWLRFLEG